MYKRVLVRPCERLLFLIHERAYGRGHEIGGLEPGKQADIIILETADYRQLGYRYGTNLVQTVIKKGEIAFQQFS